MMDKKKTIELIITISLLAALILFSINSCARIKRKLGKAGSPAKDAVSLPIAGSRPLATQTRSRELKEDAEWGRCPFSGRLYSGQAEVELNLKLTGIIWDEKDPQALIGDRFVKEASMIGPFQVIKIKKDRVILNDGNKDFELKLE